MLFFLLPPGKVVLEEVTEGILLYTHSHFTPILLKNVGKGAIPFALNNKHKGRQQGV